MILADIHSLSGLKAHATSVFPDECCGFLYGTEQADGTRIISKIREVNNAKPGDKRRRFEINGRTICFAEKFAIENDILLLGIYHSHPNHPAVPSEHDRIAAMPYFSYVIISVMQGQADHIRSWRLNEANQFEEENFSTVQINQSI
jgi:proteasome lid subunit RPN8/RPN11